MCWVFFLTKSSEEGAHRAVPTASQRNQDRTGTRLEPPPLCYYSSTVSMFLHLNVRTRNHVLYSPPVTSLRRPASRSSCTQYTVRVQQESPVLKHEPLWTRMARSRSGPDSRPTSRSSTAARVHASVSLSLGERVHDDDIRNHLFMDRTCFFNDTLKWRSIERKHGPVEDRN